MIEQPPVPGQEPAAPQPGQAPAQGGQQADPKSQDAYDKIVTAGLKILYDDATHQQIVAMLKSEANPVDKLVHAVMILIEGINDASKDMMPKQVVPAASLELLMLVAELASKLKVIDEKDTQTLQAARDKLLQQLKAKGSQPQGGQPEQAPGEAVPPPAAAPAAPGIINQQAAVGGV